MQPVSEYWLSNHVPAEMNTHATTEERCFYVVHTEELS
jgi:hypothetical protein